MSESDVVIISAIRTAIGNLNGCLSSIPAHELGGMCIKHVLQCVGYPPEKVSEVIMGQVLTAGEGQNTARQASVCGGIKYDVPATGVNMLCGSGLRAIVMGYQAIKVGDSTAVVAGGQESMSRARHCVNMREKTTFGDKSLIDTMIKDGLTDAFNNYHMGITAENLAKLWGISRLEQDEFAFRSQQKYAAAKNAGHFEKEIVPVSVKNRSGETWIQDDEFPRPSTTLEGLQKLRPAFQTDGTVTAGNSSGAIKWGDVYMGCLSDRAGHKHVPALLSHRAPHLLGGPMVNNDVVV